MRWIFWLAWSAIFYTLAGYPLVVAALAWLRPRPWSRAEICPTVSLIVAAHNEAQWIEQKLANALMADYPHERLQVLVAADGSDDETAELVRRQAGDGIELVYQPERQGKAAALNRAVKRAQGEILLFSDANAFFDPSAIKRLVASFADPDVAVVSGAKTIAGDHSVFGRAESFYWHYEGWIRRNESLVGQATGVNGEILAVRRADWQPLSPRTINDDFAIALDALARGRRVVFEPSAQSRETPTARAVDELSRRQRMLAGRWQALGGMARLIWPPRPVALWQVASHKGARALLPGFLAAASLSNIALVFTARRRTAVGWLELLCFAAQLGIALLIGARATRRPLPSRVDKVAAVATYAAVSQFAAILGLLTWLRGGQRPAWRRAERRTVPEVAEWAYP